MSSHLGGPLPRVLDECEGWANVRSEASPDAEWGIPRCERSIPRCGAEQSADANWVSGTARTWACLLRFTDVAPRPVGWIVHEERSIPRCEVGFAEPLARGRACSAPLHGEGAWQTM